MSQPSSKSGLKPIFIFSLPRSGSTLLQRILASHDQIDTCAEPWILLPVASALRDEQFADYGHVPAKKAVTDFLARTGEVSELYSRALRAFGMELYEQAVTKRANYFVDKTPRYHLIVEQILKAFPKGKFIFLWRNPLSIAASISDTWINNQWGFGHYRVDLYKGIEKLNAASKSLPNERAYRLRYEDIITRKNEKIEEIFEYLDLEYYPEKKNDILVKKIEGRFGDKTGTRVYDGISKSPLKKWKNSIKNVIRKRWCKEYLKWIGKERLTHMEYKYENLMEEVNSIEVRTQYLFADALSIFKDILRGWVHPAVHKKSLKRYMNGERLYDIH